MSDIYVLHHLGLGDHIICNSIVREISLKYDNIFVPVKHHNLQSVNFMFRDNEKIKCIGVNGDDEANNLCSNKNCIRMGMFGPNWNDLKRPNFDAVFYDQANIDFDKRWSSFYIKRDIDKEIELFNMFNVKSMEYNFIHDDINRGYLIRDEYKKGFYIAPKIKRDTIFDYIYLIENAKEVHCIDSSFLCLIESLNDIKGKLYFHKYARESGWVTPTLRKSWIIL